MDNWKALEFHFHSGPHTAWEKILILWGMDVWFGKFPLLKSLVAANVAVWLILW